MARYKLPSRVTLPRSLTVDAATLSMCLGNPSRQWLHLQRKNHGLAPSWRNGETKDWLTMTNSVADWLAARGCEVTRV